LTELALSLGLIGDDFDGQSYEPPAIDEAFLEERPIAQKPLRKDVSIRPLRDSGVVIDHMVPYKEDLLVRLLKVRERRDIYRAATVKSLALPGEIKGMLMIEDREFTDEELHDIAAVSPGCTVNFVKGAKVERKLRMKLPGRIDGIAGMVCTNKGCISRPEHLESVNPLMMKAAGGKICCHYCDQLMDSVQFL
ncbi:MAG: aspartate carbamoyltransferase regulatory subunit, partial [Deltaproteobacteria bacterium]|nr:aspartate carbamoyltransferase regulatory subunit [Deltaproteobacteria bacterium]